MKRNASGSEPYAKGAACNDPDERVAVTRRCWLVRVRLLPFFQVDISIFILLIFFDLALPRLVRLLCVRPVALLARIIERCFARILLVGHPMFAHSNPPAVLICVVAERGERWPRLGVPMITSG